MDFFVVSFCYALMKVAAIADIKVTSFNKARRRASFSRGAIAKSGAFLCYFLFRHEKRTAQALIEALKK